MAINKPNGYDEVVAGGEFTPIALGGHKLVIVKVEEATASTGPEYIKVGFDTDKADAQPEYYRNSFNNDTRQNKKWGGVINLFPLDREGKTSKMFKSFCTAVEKSNSGFQIQWGDAFCSSLKGKKVGGVFGAEEYLNANNEKKTAHKLFFFRSYDAALTADVPTPRLLETDTMTTNPAALNAFVVVDEDEDLPF